MLYITEAKPFNRIQKLRFNDRPIPKETSLRLFSSSKEGKREIVLLLDPDEGRTSITSPSLRSLQPHQFHKLKKDRSV